MSGRYTPPDETTLGGLVRPAGDRSATRRGTPTSTHASALGSGFLGLGVAIIAALQSMIGIALFLLRIDLYPSILPIAAAWLLLMVTFLGLTITISASGERLPDWLYAVFLAALAAVVWLDIVAIAPLANVGQYATASVSAGFVLLVIVTLRPRWEVLIATALLGIALVGATLATTPLTPVTIPAQAVTVALAIGPGIAGVLLVQGFERMLKRELDRVLVQSTVTAPRLAVGMLASEELARLDLDAEQLLEAVASGEAPLPLPENYAARASTLATELRLHLIEGRRETWLFHAITESEHLGRRVTVSDPGTLAGLLDDVQRDALLAALWLLTPDPVGTATARAVTVSIGPIDPQRTSGPGGLLVPMRLEVSGLRRNRVDPGVWEALDRVGRYSDSTADGALVIEIECRVENPADAARPH
ncbi:hypothetical protein [Microcella frigidaquae]|uniref:Uncharacterized protein n=1 Tax=Microcella frigidaquae TaxID=424758 RepID=A0A840XS87_9MICO|nr:hypothetical protein [Microcella frigidaquae]MBB5618789.1 hypothetical protein [Microcella frigidaquae]NHN44219.1 hypothetical protein [Microcella frigidaquae]